MIADNMPARYSVTRTPRATTSLQQLRRDIRGFANRLGWDLPGCLERFEDHVVPCKGGGYIYIHPHPRVEITFRLDEARRVATVTHFAAPVTNRVTVFVSYSHVDRQQFSEFKTFMHERIARGEVHCWSDEKIKPGDVWAEAIRTAARNAQMAVLLVSHNFLASQFIRNEELPMLKERASKDGLQISWVHVTYCPVKTTEVWKFQALSDPEKPVFDMERKHRHKTLTEIHYQIYKFLHPHADIEANEWRPQA